MSSRREFITLLGIAAAAWPVTALAQGSARPVVGYLGPGSAVSDAFRVTAFRQGLSEAGFVEGQNVTVDYRWAEEHYDRLPDVTVATVAPLGPHSSASTRACFEFARPRGLTAAGRLRTDLGCRPRLDGARRFALGHAKLLSRASAQQRAATTQTPRRPIGAGGVRGASRSGSASVITTHALFARKVRRKLSNGGAGFAAGGSSLDQRVREARDAGRRARAAYHRRRSSNANGLHGQNSAGFP